MRQNTINSQDYWDQRFKSGDWTNNKGNKQTLFHYNLLLKNIPPWLKIEISDNKMSICDLGCGMGEGVFLLKKYFNNSKITGVDFSNYAIKEAKKKYSNVSFICSDITKIEKHYDVIVSSNTLEHFEDPKKVFSDIIKLADKYFILIIPFQEENLYSEHFYSFDYDFFPLRINDHELVHYKETGRVFYEPKKYWDEGQILIVYANKKNIDISKFSLAELKNNYFNEFKLTEKKYEDKISSLNKLNKQFEDLKNKNKKLESNLINSQAQINELKINNKKYEDKISSLNKLNKQFEDLKNKNKKLEFDLFNEQKKALLFKEISKKYTSQLSSQQTKNKILKKQYESLQKQDVYLNKLINAYRSRKIVKSLDRFLKIYKSFKSSLSGIKKKSSISVRNVNSALHNKIVENCDKLSKARLNFSFTNKEPKRLNNIKVAVILDNFSYNSFKYEFKAIPINPSNWLETFENEKPDLFLCESAWAGNDSAWAGQIYSSINFKTQRTQNLFDLLDYCNENNIPTIFWNKEDPTHYEDKVCNFVDTASKFDHIFTTAEECVERYKKDCGHQSVHLLMFGAQPKMFNPIENQKRSKNIIFAGSWYGDLHAQRSKEMIEIFDSILENGYNLKIYDRSYYTHNNDPNRLFPKKYSKYINPPVNFGEIDKVYKESEYALNINTETKSNTMFARRVFELMLCNTLVLSNYSKGMSDLFGDDVIIIGKDEINLDNSEEKRINNLYNVLKNHTYSNRFKQLLNDINYEYIDDDNSISIYYVVSDQSEIGDMLKHYNSITYNPKRLVLIFPSPVSNHLIKKIIQSCSNEVLIYYLNHLQELISNKHKNNEPYQENLEINNIISNSTSYFIFANTQLEPDFVEKGLLHYSYIENKFGIALGDKFTFKKVNDVNNIIFPIEMFEKVFNSIFRDTPNKFSVYTCKITPGRFLNYNI